MKQCGLDLEKRTNANEKHSIEKHIIDLITIDDITLGWSGCISKQLKNQVGLLKLKLSD